LIDPKFPHNVGGSVRAASCFGIKQVWYTGHRVADALALTRRLPREERMRGYREVALYNRDRFLDAFGPGTVPVAVEVRHTSEQLPAFEHPERALYVFGPEDGSIPKPILTRCHRFVIIPTRHCVNLAAAVYLVLYDRLVKRQAAGLEPVLPSTELLAEQRGFVEHDHPFGWEDDPT
jgi:tRNA(Leu) C34 or U34 (ribose-2'-O)-methylase TrmL